MRNEVRAGEEITGGGLERARKRRNITRKHNKVRKYKDV